MMIQTPHAIAGMLAGLSFLPLHCQGSQPTHMDTPQVPDCSGEVVLIPSFDYRLDCDLNPPQVLASLMDDDPSGAQDERCHDAGGRVLYITESDTIACINMDF